MPQQPPETTGFVDFTYGDETFKTWYKVVGTLHAGARPLVMLHGGPGIGHGYLASHADLAATHGIPVVFYDQLGCGQSTRLPHKPDAFWTLDLFGAELDNLAAKLGIAGDFALYGHSWGGMLAADVAAHRRPPGMHALVIAGAGASTELWNKGYEEHLASISDTALGVVRAHDADLEYDKEAYAEISRKFTYTFVCHEPWPKVLSDSYAKRSEEGITLNVALTGRTFFMGGHLADWSTVDSLHEITCPTLIVKGVDDMAADVCMAPFFERIPHAKMITFGKTSHCPFYEEPEAYFRVLGQFLSAA